MSKYLVKNWNNKSLKYLENYLKTTKLPLEYKTKLKEYIALQKEENKKFANKLSNNFVYKLAVTDLLYQRKLNPFSLASGNIIAIIADKSNIAKILVKMDEVVIKAEKRKIKLWI